MSATAILYLLLFSAGLLFAFVRHPVYGLYAYLLTVYLHPPTAWWGQQLPEVRWSLVAAIVTLVATAIRRRNPELPAWFKTWPGALLLAYVVWMWVQSFWALDPVTHQEMAILFTKYVVLFYLVYAICQDERSIASFMLAHVAGCFYLGWRAFDTNVSGRLDSFGGPGIGDANTFGMQLSTGLVFAGFLLIALSGKIRWAVFLAIPFILNGIILTGSRGAFLGLMGAGLVAWYLKPRFSRKWFYFAAALGLVLFVRLAHDMFWGRIESTATALGGGESQLDSSARSRLALIQAQWQMSQVYPLGTGARGTSILSPFYVPEEYLTEQGHRSSHNTIMAVLVDQGFVGLALFSGGIYWIGVTLIRLRRMEDYLQRERLMLFQAAIGAALAASFISGQFTNNLKAEVQIWCLALLAAVYGLAKASKAYEPHKRPKDEVRSIGPKDNVTSSSLRPR